MSVPGNDELYKEIRVPRNSQRDLCTAFSPTGKNLTKHTKCSWLRLHQLTVLFGAHKVNRCTSVTFHSTKTVEIQSGLYKHPPGSYW